MPVSPALPAIPARIYNITNFGALGDGVATNTAAIQAAINAANEMHISSAAAVTIVITAVVAPRFGAPTIKALSRSRFRQYGSCREPRG